MKSSPKIRIRKNVPLSSYSNYKIGGRAKYFFEAKSISEIKEAILWAQKTRQKIFVLGGGTNLLFSDRGYSGLILKINIQYLKVKNNLISAGAGVSIEELLSFSLQHKLSGLEWAGGLPGTLGGAIRGNAGAFGGETKDNIESVEFFDVKTLEKLTCKNKACDFSYRTSLFKKKNGEFIITGAVLKLKKGDPKQIQSKIKDKIDFRKSRHPLEFPNSGSVFKNVDIKKFSQKILAKIKHVIKPDPFPVIPTAYLISEAGLKGRKVGGAMISTKHPNFIINVKNAKAKDILALISLVKSTLKRKFGVSVEEEVQIVA